jgi:hypothetical protein
MVFSISVEVSTSAAALPVKARVNTQTTRAIVLIHPSLLFSNMLIGLIFIQYKSDEVDVMALQNFTGNGSGESLAGVGTSR